MTRSLVPTDYKRTRIIGFSVTNSMWSAFRANISNPSAYELKWYSGGSVDLWANSGGIAWTYGGADPVNTGGVLNPVGGSDVESAVDRVILNVSGLSASLSDQFGTLGVGGYSNNVAQWAFYIAGAIAAIRTHHPNVGPILLQPGLGGPSRATCPTQNTTPGAPCYDASGDSQPFGVVRSSYTQPYLLSALIAACKGNVREGWMGLVSSCNDFRDDGGHLFLPSGQSADIMGAAMASYYNVNV